MKVEIAAKWAIENIIKEGLTDVFPDPFEIDLLKNNEFQKIITNEVVKAVSGNSLESLKMLPIEHVLLPKTSAFDFRRCALIQPLDTIKYLTLAILLADSIEKHRPPKARKIVYSYRFALSKGYIFDPKYNFTAFQKHVSQKTKQEKTRIFVSCDIANFYDRLNLHRLESILLSIESDKNYVKLVNQLLLSWANRDSYGLPVGSNASRILAEAALIEVDNYLVTIGANFCRFVDDYRFFAPDVHKAHYWLTQLIDRLWLEGLTINKSKTKIDDVSEIRKEEKDSDNEIDQNLINEIKPNNHKKDELRNPFRIVAGYGGTIPTKFRQSSIGEVKKFAVIDAESLLRSIKLAKLITPEIVNEFLRATLYGKKTTLFIDLPIILDKFPQFTPLIVDMLIKHKDEISLEVKYSIKSYFSKLLSNTGTYLSEYLVISMIRLLGIDGYDDINILMDYFRSLRRNAGAYIGRVTLEAMESYVSRGQVLEIRQYFIRADQWEKRQIIRIVDKHIDEDEKRPWLKNIKIQENNDLFLIETIEPRRKPTKNKKRTKKAPSKPAST